MIRKYVEHLHVDRPLFNDHSAMKRLVQSGEILNEVEKAAGKLGAVFLRFHDASPCPQPLFVLETG